MESPSQTVTRLTSQACTQYPGGLRAVFSVIREQEGDAARSESTFYADLNANPSSQGKLKVRDLISCMQITGNHDALRYLAAHFGYALTSLSAVEPDAPTVEAEMLQEITRTWCPFTPPLRRTGTAKCLMRPCWPGWSAR